MGFLARLFRPAPVTLKATVTRAHLRNDGRNAATVDVDTPTGKPLSVYVLTAERLNPGAVVNVRLATCGWELAE